MQETASRSPALAIDLRTWQPSDLCLSMMRASSRIARTTFARILLIGTSNEAAEYGQDARAFF